MVTPVSLYRRTPALHRRSRRIAIAAAFAGFPLQIVGYTTVVATGMLSTLVWAPISVALFSGTLIGVVAIYGYGQGRMDRRERLDERQRAMIDRALILSYGVLTTIIVAIGGVIAIYASFVGPVTIEMTAFTPWLVAIGLYIPFLPFAALAWLEPDAPGNDDDR
jgi:hypothetical protein